jgi:hypothetical protein
MKACNPSLFFLLLLLASVCMATARPVALSALDREKDQRRFHGGHLRNRRRASTTRKNSGLAIARGLEETSHSYSYNDCTETYKRLYCDGATLYHSSNCGDTCSSDCAVVDWTSATNGQYYCDPSDSSIFYKDEDLDGTADETHYLPSFTNEDGCFWDSCNGDHSYSYSYENTRTAPKPTRGFIAMVRLFITVRTVGIRAVAIVRRSTLRPQRMASITAIPRIHPFIIKMNFWPMVLLSIKLRPTLFQNLPMTMAVIGRRAVETTIATATIATHAMTAAHLAMAPVSLTAIRA